ncbi:ABC transporter substrate-binding protein [Streptomyces adelaidensis]|uniref:ABC transporter substrate-binding protein n=1 Tax=Streptomyces adelaidensis TaxID=2796465 RepID=UPI001904A485|nr:extracellular solute-binding protein [Streptomyces adelaidensis]
MPTTNQSASGGTGRSPLRQPTRRAVLMGALGAGAALATSACSSGGSGGNGGGVTITWFVGLGTGADPGQPEKQQRVVDAFNASQNEITLKLNVVSAASAQDTLATQISGGNAPDIVGPVGIGGAQLFDGQWLDLAPLVKSEGFDTSVYSTAQMDAMKDRTGAQVALPFGVYPSFIWYNKDLFDEAKLPYPPQKFGAKYNGGTWDMAALRELAKKLTVDANGNDATSSAFDPKKIVQWGFDPQYNEGTPQNHGTFFGAGSYVAKDNKTAQIPPAWLAEWKWYYDMIWTDHSAPTYQQLQSDTLNKGNAFATGKVAMAFTHTWYLASLTDSSGTPQTFWDIAANPSYNGEITDKQNSDSFRLTKAGKHPEAAFKVLAYLLTTGAGDLLKIYNAMPANKKLQADYIKSLDKTWTQGVDWQVALDALEHPDVPSAEGWMPNYNKSVDLTNKFGNRWVTTPGLDIDAEAAKLRTQLQALFDTAG